MSQAMVYDKGKKNGFFVMYYPSGSMLSQGTYVDDVEDGVFYKYHENGVVLEFCRYASGVVSEGPFLYDPSGKLITPQKDQK